MDVIEALPSHAVPASASSASTLLRIEGLRTVAGSGDDAVDLVNDVTLSLSRGETLAVVGESGSGKSMTFLSALRLLPPGCRAIGGRVMFGDADLRTLDEEKLRQIRGAQIGMVFQDPLMALNPVFTIGEQMIVAILAHRRIGRRAARGIAIDALRRVQIPSPESRIDAYPHQLSGGMRQRVLIAMAIALEPRMLIADEPTTALDVTVQAQILDLLASLRDETRMGMILITHDLGLVARYADRVIVMYAGKIVEQGPVLDIFADAAHPYTRNLLRSVPRLDTPVMERLYAIEGAPPQPGRAPCAGCAFTPRCDVGAQRAICADAPPPLVSVGDGRVAACHFPLHAAHAVERTGCDHDG